MLRACPEWSRQQVLNFFYSSLFRENIPKLRPQRRSHLHLPHRDKAGAILVK